MGPAVVLRSMSRRRKVLPGETALHANDSLSMSERSWRLVQVCLGYTSRMAERISSFYSAVMDALIISEWSWMPKKVRVVTGPLA